MVHPDADPTHSSAVSFIDRYKDRYSEKVSISTSTTIAAALATTIAEDDVGVTIISDGTVQYNPVGAAGATSAFLPTVYTIVGGKERLDLVQLFAAAAVDVSFIIFNTART